MDICLRFFRLYQKIFFFIIKLNLKEKIINSQYNTSEYLLLTFYTISKINYIKSITFLYS